MIKKEIIISFIAYSILGWCLDSLTRSVIAMEWTAHNGLGIPFSPLYGFGAIGILWSYRYIRNWKIWQQFLLYYILLPLYEYVGGVFSEWLLGHRLWDYSSVPLNIHGHTDPLHALIWASLALLVIHGIQPYIYRHS